MGPFGLEVNLLNGRLTKLDYWLRKGGGVGVRGDGACSGTGAQVGFSIPEIIFLFSSFVGLFVVVNLFKTKAVRREMRCEVQPQSPDSDF